MFLDERALRKQLYLTKTFSLFCHFTVELEVGVRHVSCCHHIRPHTWALIILVFERAA